MGLNGYRELTVYPIRPDIVQLTRDPDTYILPEEWLPLHFEVNYSGAGRIEIYDETKTTLINPGEPISPGTYYMKGVTLSSQAKDIELLLVHDCTGFKDKICCTVFNGVQIVDVIMPNDFIATPSLYNEQRFGKEDSPSQGYQVAKTDVRIWYYLDENVAWDSAWVDFTCNGKVYEIPEYLNNGPGLHYADVSLELKSPKQPDEEYDWALDDNVQFQVILTGRLRDFPELTFQSTLPVPGRHLIDGIQFSPKAYETSAGAPTDPVCPYTHVQDPFSGDPDNKWWGLLMLYGTLYDLDALIVEVSEGDLWAKQLALPPGALVGGPFVNKKVKWEGYDNSLPGPEPAEVPYCVFPGAAQPAPACVVAEGSYWYRIQATDSRVITDPASTLTQSYEILKIPIHVRYNMTDAEK